RTHFEDGWRVHFAAWGRSGSGTSGGSSRVGTRKGSPLGRKRGGWPGRFPAGDGFDGFDGGVLTVSVSSGWVSVTGSFGNSWRRDLRRLNSSMARRYRRSGWAW